MRPQIDRPDVERVRDNRRRSECVSLVAIMLDTLCPRRPFKVHAKRMRTTQRARLACMPPNLAQVLNTVAHEIRTPLAVSQGYLKLYLDGRLTNADDQRRAFQQTRQALGTLATLCNDMGKVSALAEAASPAFTERVSARASSSTHVQKAQAKSKAPRGPATRGAASIATHESPPISRTPSRLSRRPRLTKRAKRRTRCSVRPMAASW